MVYFGKCPNCKSSISSVEFCSLKGESDTTHEIVAYVCPNCKTILGVQIDPTSLADQTIRTLKSQSQVCCRVAQRTMINYGVL